jgi:hypothetical protein
MRKKNILVILTLVIILFAASCAKEGPSGPTGPAGPSLTGNISGHVMLFDKYGSKIFTGLNNVGIFLNGSSSVVHPDSATGSYIYSSLISGVYNLAAYNTGYGAAYLNSLQLVSGTINADLKLSARPDSFLYSFTSVINTSDSSDSLTITCNADPRRRNFIVFLNRIDSVSSNPVYYLLNYVGAIPANATNAYILVPKYDLANAGFISGSKVFYAAYSYVVNDGSVFEDYNTGRKGYTAISAIPLLDSTTAP